MLLGFEDEDAPNDLSKKGGFDLVRYLLINDCELSLTPLGRSVFSLASSSSFKSED